MKKNNKKGFTIVELVIVIAVIGILSAILIPTFVGVTKAANEAALKSNLSNAYSMYAAEAADGKVDEGGATIVFKAQADIELANGDKTYIFDNDKKEWKTGTLATELLTVKTFVVAGNQAASTFGEYTVQYYVAAA